MFYEQCHIVIWERSDQLANLLFLLKPLFLEVVHILASFFYKLVLVEQIKYIIPLFMKLTLVFIKVEVQLGFTGILILHRFDSKTSGLSKADNFDY